MYFGPFARFELGLPLPPNEDTHYLDLQRSYALFVGLRAHFRLPTPTPPDAPNAPTAPDLK